MRVALFTETFLPRVDGITNTLCHVLPRLAERNVETLLFAPAGAPPSFAATPIVSLSGLPLPQYPEFKVIPPWAPFGKALRAFNPDLVHVLNPVTLGAGALFWAKRAGVPVVASYHTDVPGFMRRWGHHTAARLMQRYMRWLHNHADLNLAPSRFTLTALAREGYRHLALWGRGVDTTRFNPQRRSHAWRLRLSAGHPEQTLLLFVGRLSHEKRVEWVRAALDAVPGVRFAVVGDGPARAQLERTFAHTPTVFVGALRGDDLAAAYASADLFVFPSPNETLGNVVLEAMASGLPVIAPASGGLLDHARDGVNALLFPPEDRAAFVACIQRAVRGTALRAQLGAAALQHARQCTWEHSVEALISAYRSVLQVNAKGVLPHPAPQWRT